MNLNDNNATAVLQMQKLHEFSDMFIELDDKKLVVEQFENYLKGISPAGAMEVFRLVIFRQMPQEEAKTCISKLTNIFFKYMSGFTWANPSDNYMINHLFSENRRVELVISEMKKFLKKIFSSEPSEIRFLHHLYAWLPALKAYQFHYMKIEKLIFPFFMKLQPRYHAYLEVMRSFHHDFSGLTKRINDVISSANPDLEMLNRDIGRLFFLVFLEIFREENIFLPVAVRSIPENNWDYMTLKLKHMESGF